MNEEEELIPLEVDDAKVRQIITKIRKSIKSFSITNGKSFVLPPRDELLSSKYQLGFLALRNEGLAIEKLIKDAEELDDSNENSSLIPKYINSHYLDGRFLIFTTHAPIRANISHIQYDLSLKFGQIVAFRSDSQKILLGMIATKLNEDVYRVFDLSDDFMFTICTSNQLCPFPIALPKVIDATSSFSAGDKVIAFSYSSLQDRKHFTIQSGEVVCLSMNAETNEENYNIKLDDGSVITTEPHFLTKPDSPFTCSNEQAEEQKQEHLSNGIDPTVLLDPKEARKFKNANAKKLRDMKKKAAENQLQENQQDDAEGNLSSNKKKEKKKASITMATRHSLRSRPNSTSDGNANSNTNANVSTSPNKQTDSKEVNREAVGIPMKLPLTPDLHIIDSNTTSSPSTIHPIPMAAPPRVIQLQNMQMHHQLQQQYLFQQQMMLHHHQPFVQPQGGKTQVSQSLTVSPTQFVQHQQHPIYPQNMPQIQQPIYQGLSPPLGSAMRVESPVPDSQKSPEKVIENQIIQQSDSRHVPPAKDETRPASCYKPQNNLNGQSNIQTPTSILVQQPQNLLDDNVSSQTQVVNEEKQENNSVESSISNNENEANEETLSNNISIITSEPDKSAEKEIEPVEQSKESMEPVETSIEPTEQKDLTIEPNKQEESDLHEPIEPSIFFDKSDNQSIQSADMDELDELINQVRSDMLNGRTYDNKISIESQKNLKYSNSIKPEDPIRSIELEKAEKSFESSGLMNQSDTDVLDELKEPSINEDLVRSVDPLELQDPTKTQKSEESENAEDQSENLKHEE